MMDRERIKASLLDLVDGTLPADEARAVEAALGDHPDLQREYADLKRAVELAAALPPLEMPEALGARIGEAVDRVATDRRPASLPGGGARLLPWIGSLAAALVLGLVAIQLFSERDKAAPSRDVAVVTADADEKRPELHGEPRDEQPEEEEEAEDEDSVPVGLVGGKSRPTKDGKAGAFAGLKQSKLDEVQSGLERSEDTWSAKKRIAAASDERRKRAAPVEKKGGSDLDEESAEESLGKRTKQGETVRAVGGAKGGRRRARGASQPKPKSPAKVRSKQGLLDKSAPTAAEAPVVEPRGSTRANAETEQPAPGVAPRRGPPVPGQPKAAQQSHFSDDLPTAKGRGGRFKSTSPPAPAARGPGRPAVKPLGAGPAKGDRPGANRALAHKAPRVVDSTIGTLAVRVTADDAPAVRTRLRRFLSARELSGRSIRLEGPFGGAGRPAVGLVVALTDRDVVALRRELGERATLVAGARIASAPRSLAEPVDRSRGFAAARGRTATKKRKADAGYTGRVRPPSPPAGKASPGRARGGAASSKAAGPVRAPAEGRRLRAAPSNVPVPEQSKGAADATPTRAPTLAATPDRKAGPASEGKHRDVAKKATAPMAVRRRWILFVETK